MADLKVSKGEPITAEKWNALVDALDDGGIMAGPGLRRRVIGGKVVLTTRRKSQKTPPKKDFALYDATKVVDGTLKVMLGVTNGTITAAGLLSNGTDPLPTGMTAGGDPEYTEDIDAETVAWIELDIDDSGDAPEITDIHIEVGTPDDIPNNSSTKFCITLGDFAKSDDGKSLKIGSGAGGIGSQQVEGCRTWFPETTVKYNYRVSQT